jgi:hypothetical protein
MKHTCSLIDLLLNEIGNECPVAATRQGGSLSAFAAKTSVARFNGPGTAMSYTGQEV